MENLFYILNASIIALFAPAFLGFLQKLRSIVEEGPDVRIFQPYRNIRMHVSQGVGLNWRNFARCTYFALTLVLAASVPVLGAITPFPAGGDIILFVSLIALAHFISAVGGGTSVSLLHSALAKGAMIVSLLGVALLSGTTNLSKMVGVLPDALGEHSISFALIALAFLLALLVLNMHSRDAAAPQRSGLSEWADANLFLISVTVFVSIFMPFATSGSVAIGAAVCLVKVATVCALIALIAPKLSKRITPTLIASYLLCAAAILIIVL